MYRHRAAHMDAYVSTHATDARFFAINIAERCSVRAAAAKAPEQYIKLTHQQVREAWGGAGWGCNHACAHGDLKRDGVHGAWPEAECTGYTEQITSEEINSDGKLIPTGVCEFYFGAELAIFRGAEFDAARLERPAAGTSKCYVRGVDCGGHSAARCKFCPERTNSGMMVKPEWQCNGQCMTKYRINKATKHVQGRCAPKLASDVNLVNCGGHSAHSCTACVTRFTFVSAPQYLALYCNGECDHERGDCGVPAAAVPAVTTGDEETNKPFVFATPPAATSDDKELLVTDELIGSDDDEESEADSVASPVPVTADGAVEQGVGFDVSALGSRINQ